MTTEDSSVAVTEETGQEVNNDWRTSLPESVQTWEEVQTSQDADSFWNQLSNQRALIGRSVQVPGADASTEARQEYVQKMLEKTPEVILKPNEENMDDFYKAMGRPETADKYTPPQVEGMEFDETSLKAFAEVAIKGQLTDKQYQQIAIEMQQRHVQEYQAMEQQRTEGLQGLKGEWGMAYEQHVNAAQAYVNKLLPSIGDVNNLPASSIKELYNASQSIGTEGTALTETSGDSAAITPQEAQEKISEIMKNSEHPARNPRDPSHKAAMERLLDLQDYAKGRNPADRPRI